MTGMPPANEVITMTERPASRLAAWMLAAMMGGHPLALAEPPAADPPVAQPPVAETPVAQPLVAEAGTGAPRTVAGRDLARWAADADNGDRVVRLRAVRTLGLFGAAAGEALAGALESDDPAVRYLAAVQLGRIGGEPLRAAAVRLRTLRDDGEQRAVQMAVAFALCRAGEEAGNLDLLIERLDDPERGMACSAAELLGSLGAAAAAAVPALQQTVARHASQSGGDHQIGGAARNALRKIQPAAVEEDR